MTTETYILLILGLSFLLTLIKTAIKESLRNSKPTNINYGTINNHYYGLENPQNQNRNRNNRDIFVTSNGRYVRRQRDD